MSIYVFYHVSDIFDYEQISTEQINTLEYSGLLDAASKVFINQHYSEQSFDKFKKQLKPYKNVEWLVGSPIKEDYEHSTAVLYQQIAKENKGDFNALYFHQKGLTHKHHARYPAVNAWRQLLDYWNIEQWQLCNEQLNAGADTTGCLYTTNEGIPHYSGTTRWMKASAIRRMPQLQLPSSIGFSKQLSTKYDYIFPSWMPYRLEVEMQVGINSKTANIKMASVYQNNNYDGYSQIITREAYAIK
jgi:hypothetical protein